MAGGIVKILCGVTFVMIGIALRHRVRGKAGRQNGWLMAGVLVTLVWAGMLRMLHVL